MPGQSFSLMHVIRTMANAYKEDRRSDADLLAEYAQTHSQTAFAALMARHGPMVWNICRTILGNEVDAEDAHQAAFMALAAKAHKIFVKDTLAGWLCQAARRSAFQGRRARKSQKNMQKRLQSLGRPEVGRKAIAAEDDSAAIVYEELLALPEKQRVALVLHYLEGKTGAEIAQILGVKEPSVWARLARGKACLQDRLTKRGLALSAAGLSAMLEATSSQAALSHQLVAKTVQAATAFRNGKLTDGLAQLATEVLKQSPTVTPWWKTGWLIAILSVASLGAGVGGVAWKAGFFGTKADDGAQAGLMQKAKSPPQAVKGASESARLDVYGDPLPPGALARFGTVRFRRDPFLSSEKEPVLTADNRLFLPGSTDNRFTPLRCYDLTTGKPMPHFNDAQGRARSFTQEALISDDGGLLLQKSASGPRFDLWDVARGKTLNKGGAADVITDRSFPRARKICLSYNGGGLGLVTWNGSNYTDVEFSAWDKDASTARWTDRCTKLLPLRLMYSADDKILMALCIMIPPRIKMPKKYTVLRWDAASGKKLSSWTSDDGIDGAITWSRNGRILATGPKLGGDTASLWDMASGKKLRDIRLDEGQGQFVNLALSPDGALFAANTLFWRDQTDHASCGLWDAATGKLIRRWDSPIGRQGKLTFSLDGKSLVAVPGSYSISDFIHVWDVASGKEVNQACDDQGHTDAISSLVFSDRGRTLTSVGANGRVFVWDADASSVRCSHRLQSSGYFRDATLTTDASTALYLDLWTFRFYDVATGKQTRSFEAPKGGVCTHLRISRDKTTLACLHGNFLSAGACWYDLATGKYEDRLTGETFAFSSNGRWLAVGGKDGELSVWDYAKKKRVAKATTWKIYNIAFSPDGSILAVSTETERRDNVIAFWRIVGDDSNGCRLEGPCSQTQSLGASQPHEFSALTFSPDGRTLAATRTYPRNDDIPTGANAAIVHHYASDVIICLWETATGKERVNFNHGGACVKCMTFAPDGRRLASGHADGTILTWDLTGRAVAEKRSAERLSDKQLASLWEDLAGTDAQRAGRAVWNLAAAGRLAVDFLKRRLEPAAAKGRYPSLKDLSQLIADLDAGSYTVRQKARLKLQALDEKAEPAMRALLTQKASAEMRRSVQAFLKKIEERRITQGISPNDSRTLRAIEVLEHIDGPESRQTLEMLLSGDPNARMTQEAQKGLAFWKAVHSSK